MFDDGWLDLFISPAAKPLVMGVMNCLTVLTVNLVHCTIVKSFDVF